MIHLLSQLAFSTGIVGEAGLGLKAACGVGKRITVDVQVVSKAEGWVKTLLGYKFSEG